MAMIRARIMKSVFNIIMVSLAMSGIASVSVAKNQNNGEILFNKTKIWTPYNYNDLQIGFVDPYSIWKISDQKWDINLSMFNNENQYQSNQTGTVRIDCNKGTFQDIGWRISGILYSYDKNGYQSYKLKEEYIKNGTMISTIKDYLCGVKISNSNYYWAYSKWKNGNSRDEIESWWISNNTVTISLHNNDLRQISMAYVSGASKPSLFKFYIKCSAREWTDGASNWAPMQTDSGIEVFFAKMCSEHFNSMTYEMGEVTPPPSTLERERPSSKQSNNGTDKNKLAAKCTAMGFRAGTPKFEQCVLTLTQ